MSVPGISEPTKFVTFRLEEEVFGLRIDRVREVLDFTTVTKVPRTPDFMRGVINLRGSVVPVVDLKLKFGMDETVRRAETRIVIVEIDLDGDAAVLGALADSVSEVIELEPDQIGPPPRIGTRLRTEFIRGMGRRGDEFIVILNVDQVFSLDELAMYPADKAPPRGVEQNVA
ncbi:MAG: chemotaxis protein CheW [Proteobacteria bacterium]|nr:chemotaxis protein CheW [Pseudomonadota bacterium]